MRLPSDRFHLNYCMPVNVLQSRDDSQTVRNHLWEKISDTKILRFVRDKVLTIKGSEHHGGWSAVHFQKPNDEGVYTAWTSDCWCRELRLWCSRTAASSSSSTDNIVCCCRYWHILYDSGVHASSWHMPTGKGCWKICIRTWGAESEKAVGTKNVGIQKCDVIWQEKKWQNQWWEQG